MSDTTGRIIDPREAAVQRALDFCEKSDQLNMDGLLSRETIVRIAVDMAFAELLDDGSKAAT